MDLLIPIHPTAKDSGFCRTCHTWLHQLLKSRSIELGNTILY